MSSNFDQGLHHLDVPNKDVEEELWSSPLMHYTSPFDDYKELFDDIENDQVLKFPDVSNGPMEDLTRQKSSTSHSTSSRRARTSGSSQSQPNSRSNSPNSRLGYVSHTRKDKTPAKPRRSGIIRSQGASREGSPNRYGHSGRERRLSGSKIPSSGGKAKG